MIQFHNPELNAPNVMEFDVDPAIVADFAPLAYEQPAGEFAVERPAWSSDMAWISPNTINAFRFFQTRFHRLGIAERMAQYLDIDQTVRMFSGFLVSRSRCENPDWHYDWIDTNNEAFTFLTPIYETPPDFGLIYRRNDDTAGIYHYRPGKGIVFGDGFTHSTMPGHSDPPVVLLCFTFGTDKMEHWPAIERTSGTQGNLIRLPDGRFIVRDIDNPALAE